ncbi:phosphotransferase family protein [Arthrobacter sp. H16F315]|uniref:phosphotransferase family protein n=1 Tax=Arthrobacter sp. H16F315 TaxID=2955314 RepID=UPI002096ED46|nr:aminoglycoside phosphotransferase family protein [Arthrobacter sp. H16F315]MDD1477915.1 aminoglycoside phosphotransferase family protein [Arthrobacter sp. H16F315]
MTDLATSGKPEQLVPVRQRRVVEHLVQRGLLTSSDVVDRLIHVRDVTRRNRNYEVRAEGISGWFLKQGTDPSSVRTVAREAEVTAHLRSRAGAAVLAALPERLDYDPASGILAVTLFDDVLSGEDYHRRVGKFPLSVGRSLGRILAGLHGTPPGSDAVWGDSSSPWVLGMHEPWLDSLRTASGAGLAVLRLVQKDLACCETLDALRRTWRPTSIVHNDLKWDNVLLFKKPGQRGRSVRVIDWELASLGDPTWDVGAVLAAYLASWVRSVPANGERSSAGYAGSAGVPLATILPAQAAFWREYTRAAGLDTVDQGPLVTRVMQMAAARLILSAVESSQHAYRLSGDVVLLLQLASNMADRPLEAARHLCGISA